MSCDAVIIEDEETIAMAIRLVFAHQGICVREAHTGGEGIMVARRERPVVVLVDVRLPDINAWEVCRTLKRGWEGWRPVIIFVTAATQATDRQMAEKVGGDEFVAKPFEIIELANLVRRYLHAHAGT
ncbi:MAG: response regulator [Chitinivibrionales bacterium]|nr:response regulator [Chitinivibrionales bacterium]MBD3357490.1 response regulator [Chitinivibrionales bacterium]